MSFLRPATLRKRFGHILARFDIVRRFSDTGFQWIFGNFDGFLVTERTAADLLCVWISIKEWMRLADSIRRPAAIIIDLACQLRTAEATTAITHHNASVNNSRRVPISCTLIIYFSLHHWVPLLLLCVVYTAHPIFFCHDLRGAGEWSFSGIGKLLIFSSSLYQNINLNYNNML